MPTLRWLTRDTDVRAAEKVPYRLLEDVPDLGFGNQDAGNMLIQGDNLEALKALLPYYAGQVKCIYIDPPYNTGSAFEHYDDNLEHSKWLAMMWPRLELLRELLAENGSIWVSIDDREGHYLKVIMDEVFGRSTFWGDIIWQHSIQGKNDAKTVSLHHNHTLVFGRFERNLLPRSEKHNKNYANKDGDPKGRWRAGDVRSPAYRENLCYPLPTPNGGTIPHPENGWRWSKTLMDEKISSGEVRFSKDQKKITRRIYLANQPGRVPETIWFGDEVGTTRLANTHLKSVFDKGAGFDTPKPEQLMERIIHIATKPGDLVLDSFLGSGTTAAVAQKMGRRYIGIEMGDHAVTHCVPRLQKVVEGEQGGISKAQNWQGGGGFRFYRLGPPVFDELGQLAPDIRFPVLAAHIWFAEVGAPWSQPANLVPFLGAHNDQGYALLYNGILGDKSVNGGNVLTRKTLGLIRAAADDFKGPITVYGERTVLSDASLKTEQIEFKQTPYDVKARK